MISGQVFVQGTFWKIWKVQDISQLQDYSPCANNSVCQVANTVEGVHPDDLVDGNPDPKMQPFEAIGLSHILSHVSMGLIHPEWLARYQPSTG